MGIFDRFRGTRPTASARPQPARSPAARDTDDDFTDEELTEAVRESLLPGFFDEDEVIERVADAYDLADDDPRLLEIAGQVAGEHEERLASGRGPSDYDRLAAAFRQLQQEGVVARMNFTCCSSCGFTEIDDERTPRERVINGEYRYVEREFVFFHHQDAERLVDPPALLYLGYGSFLREPSDGDERAGRHVAQVLEQHGLDVDWNGDVQARICVRISDWRKPMPV